MLLFSIIKVIGFLAILIIVVILYVSYCMKSSYHDANREYDNHNKGVGESMRSSEKRK